MISICEPHTDIFKKDPRKTFYGYKICLTCGRSNFISDCLIVKGDPPDFSLTVDTLARHDQLYGYYPLKGTLNGSLLSKYNLKATKARKIKEVFFAKERGIKEEGHVPKPLDIQKAPAFPGQH